MLDAIAHAARQVHLEVYSFALDSIGGKFLQALEAAAARGVAVSVIVDGWGSLRTGRTIASRLGSAGCQVTIYNPFSTLFLGRLRRNHRKLLIVDDQLGFLGGLNIGDAYADAVTGWADVALEVSGSAIARLAARLRGDRVPEQPDSGLRIFISGLGGGHRLRKRYVKAIGRARERVLLAHAYFLPNRALVRSLTAAARRGVQVTLLLAGQSDVPFARTATQRLYRQFLRAGVEIFEWTRSVLHAKAAAVDGSCFLVGSFNLDPLSLANLEALVEVEESATVSQGTGWIESKIALSRRVTARDCAGPFWRRWLLDVVGLWAARLADWLGRTIANRQRIDSRAERRGS